MPGLVAVDEFPARSLPIAFLDMGRQRLAFLVGPAFLGVLRFQSATEYVFSACITAAGKALVDEYLKVGRNVLIASYSPLLFSS